MKVGCPSETAAGERRVAMTPDSVRQIQKLGYDCVIQAGAGEAAGELGSVAGEPPWLWPLLRRSDFELEIAAPARRRERINDSEVHAR
ncbi:MAG: hypothetical protein VXW25_01785, partial [Pseudomonadota bacterium]|nr:hypothetical protein [Pseudomonadota bacterium]